MADRVGQRLGNYRLIRLVGKGGFAEVYLGEHVRLHTQAAVKVLSTRLASPNEVESFEQEAQTIAHLKHPHIVRVLDFDVEEDTPFLVMDYAPSGSLRQKHPKGTILALTTIISYIKPIAEALQYAHVQRIVHRDVKPENMLIGDRDELLLSDFGIAIVAQSSRYQSTQSVGGTMAYIAPEQIQGHPRTASDQYSLGIVVYEWLCGSCPFHGSMTEIVAQHLAGSPPPLCEKLPTISPEVEQVVLTALEKDPRKRFRSVQAFATALEQASGVGQPYSSTPSQAPTILGQPLLPPKMASPVMQLSQQTNAPPLNEGVYTPPISPNQSRQRRNNSGMLSRPEPTHQGISRRTIVLGLGVAALTVAGGGLTWLLSSRKSLPSSFLGTVPTRIPLGTKLYTYRGHSDFVKAVAWSPDGKRIGSASDDKTVQVWNAADGAHVLTYHGHSNSVQALSWSPDSTRIVSGSGDGTVQVWDATDGAHVYTYHGHTNKPYGYVTAVAWSPDGKRIASAAGSYYDRTVQVWDAVDGGNVYVFRDIGLTLEPDAGGGAYAVTWSPDGKRIASAGGYRDYAVQVWDATNGGHRYVYRGHSLMPDAVAWSPNGRRIASGSWDKTVQVWDAVDGGNVYVYHGHTGNVIAVAWSPDGKYIASGGDDHTVQVWNAADGAHLLNYHGHSELVTAVAWSSDGRYIASGSLDKTVQVWVAG